MWHHTILNKRFIVYLLSQFPKESVASGFKITCVCILLFLFLDFKPIDLAQLSLIQMQFDDHISWWRVFNLVLSHCLEEVIYCQGYRRLFNTYFWCQSDHSSHTHKKIYRIYLCRVYMFEIFLWSFIQWSKCLWSVNTVALFGLI